jgi:hypothetical protein
MFGQVSLDRVLRLSTRPSSSVRRLRRVRARGMRRTRCAVLLTHAADSSDLQNSAVCPHAVRAADRPHPVGRNGGGGGEA